MTMTILTRITLQIFNIRDIIQSQQSEHQNLKINW